MKHKELIIIIFIVVMCLLLCSFENTNARVADLLSEPCCAVVSLETGIIEYSTDTKPAGE